MRFSPWKMGEYCRWDRCWDQYSWLSAIPWKWPLMYWNQQTADYSTHHCRYEHVCIWTLDKLQATVWWNSKNKPIGKKNLIIFGQYQTKLATVLSPLCVVGYVLSQFLLGSAAHRLLTWNSILYSTTVGRSEDAICEVIRTMYFLLLFLIAH